MAIPTGRRVASAAAALAAALACTTAVYARRDPISASRFTFDKLMLGLHAYVERTGKWPGEGSRPDENAFPACFDALVLPVDGGEPIMAFRPSDVAVLEDGGYRPATEEEIGRAGLAKHLMDPRGRQYIYRLLPESASRDWTWRSGEAEAARMPVYAGRPANLRIHFLGKRKSS